MQGSQPSSWGLTLSAEYSDNIRRTTVDRIADTMIDAGVLFNVNESRRRFNARIAADVRYREYMEDTYERQVVGGLNGFAGLAIIPENFIWIVQDNFGQVAVDAYAVETPDNRQHINYFTTGPDIALPLGSRTNFVLNGRWSDVDYEESLTDSRNVSGNAALQRELTARTSLSLNYAVSRVRYEDAVNTGYDEREAFLRFSGEGRRTLLTADVGVTEMEQADQISEGTMARVNFDRTFGAGSSVSLTLGSEFSDTAGVFRLDQTFGGVVVGNSSAVAFADPFRTEYASLAWRLNGLRNRFLFSGMVRRERHETQTLLDRRLLEAKGSVDRNITSRLSANLDVLYSHNDFYNTEDRFGEWSVRVGMAWQMTSAFSISGHVMHEEFGGRAGYRDYEENRVMLRLTYTRAR